MKLPNPLVSAAAAAVSVRFGFQGTMEANTSFKEEETENYKASFSLSWWTIQVKLILSYQKQKLQTKKQNR